MGNNNFETSRGAALGLMAEVGAYLADARQQVGWQEFPYLVLCHQSALLRPDGELEYTGSYVIGRYPTLDQAHKKCAEFNYLAKSYGAINLKYEVCRVEPVEISDLSDIF